MPPDSLRDSDSQALVRILNALGQALEAIAEGVVVSDPRQEDNPIVWMNQAFSRLSGYDRDEVVGKNCRFLQGEDTDPGSVERVRRAIQRQERCMVELLNYRKDGRPFWNRLSIVPVFDDAGEIEFFVGIQSDVTALRQTEAEVENLLRQAESPRER